MHTIAPLPSLPPLPPGSPSRLVIIDDHPIVRTGINRLLAHDPSLIVCGEAATAQEAVRAVALLRPALALLDLSLPGTAGVELIPRLLAVDPALRILVFTMYEDSEHILAALRAGARGYLRKRDALEALTEAIHTVRVGNVYLSPSLSPNSVIRELQHGSSAVCARTSRLSARETEIFRLIGLGVGTRDIATRLGLSVKTIETHRCHIKEKLEIAETGKLTRFAADWLLAADDGRALPVRPSGPSISARKDAALARCAAVGDVVCPEGPAMPAGDEPRRSARRAVALCPALPSAASI